MKFFLLFISFSVLVLNANLKNVRPPRVDLIMISPPALDASCAVASLPVEAVEAANSFLDAINENDLNRLKLILIDENAFTFLESVLKKHTGLRSENTGRPFAVFQAIIVRQDIADGFWFQYALQGGAETQFVRNMYIASAILTEKGWKIRLPEQEQRLLPLRGRPEHQ